jgi:hypothetical protein
VAGEPEVTRVVLWPAWLVAEHKVPDVAQDVERDTATTGATDKDDKDADGGGAQSEDARRRRRALRRQLRDKKRGLRTVCCYGDGRFMKARNALALTCRSSRLKFPTADPQPSLFVSAVGLVGLGLLSVQALVGC